MIPALKRGDRNEAMAALQDASAFAGSATAATSRAVQLVQAYQAEMDLGAEASVRNKGLLALLALALMVMVIMTFIGITTGSGISTATKEALQLARAIAEGNLIQADMKISGRDELAELGEALNHMKESLHEVIRSIANTSTHVAVSSEQLSATSQQISASTGRDLSPGQCGLARDPESKPESAECRDRRGANDHDHPIHCLQCS